MNGESEAQKSKVSRFSLLIMLLAIGTVIIFGLYEHFTESNYVWYNPEKTLEEAKQDEMYCYRVMIEGDEEWLPSFFRCMHDLGYSKVKEDDLPQGVRVDCLRTGDFAEYMRRNYPLTEAMSRNWDDERVNEKLKVLWQLIPLAGILNERIEKIGEANCIKEITAQTGLTDSNSVREFIAQIKRFGEIADANSEKEIVEIIENDDQLSKQFPVGFWRQVQKAPANYDDRPAGRTGGTREMLDEIAGW